MQSIPRGAIDTGGVVWVSGPVMNANASGIFKYYYLSELIGLPVYSVTDGRRVGGIVDVAATLGQVYPKVSGLLLRTRQSRKPQYLPWSCVKNGIAERRIEVLLPSSPADGDPRTSEQEILVRKTFLDQQVISMSGFKVVRVNDLQFLLDHTALQNLWLVHVDIGVTGLLRRLGWLRPANAMFHWVVDRDIRDKFIPWKYVQPTSTTSVSGSLHLKIDSSRFVDVHPADLADIFEELGIEERVLLLGSLDPGTAAAALQEMPIKLRIQLAEEFEPARLAAIIDEMAVDEAVDLLDELAPAQRNEIHSLLDPEKSAELRELSTLSAYRVGRIMTTDVLTARKSDTVGDVLASVRAQAEEAELIYYVYVIDDDERLEGLATLRELLIADPQTIIADVMVENVVTVELDTSIKRVAQVFFKYNFDAVPVVDDEHRLQGLVSLRDALEAVFPKMAED